MTSPSVFISSTFKDFKEERIAVANVLNNFNIKVNALGIEPASNKSPKEKIIKGIHSADFIILLIGNRYGSILEHYSKTKSVTHWEYFISRCKKKPVLVYSFPENKQTDDQDNEFKKKQHLLNQFKDELGLNHDVKYISSIEELENSVRESIIPMYSEALNDLIDKCEKIETERLNLIGQLVILEDELKSKDTKLNASPMVLALTGMGDNSLNPMSMAMAVVAKDL